MESYNNRESGISQYAIGEDYIEVKYKTGKTYKYTRSTCGEEHLFNMMVLATQNRDLNTYINIYQPGFIGEKKPIPEPERSMLFALKQPLSPKTKKKESTLG